MDGVGSTRLAEQIAGIPTKVFRLTRNHSNPPLTFSSIVLLCKEASTHLELKIIWDHGDLISGAPISCFKKILDDKESKHTQTIVN